MTSRVNKIPIIRELTDDDVFLGRGFPSIENEGNVRFRELVRSRAAEYHAAFRRLTKDSIARDVVNTILRRNGRFLTQLDHVPNIKGLVLPAGARLWVVADEAAVLIKAKQALRDHADDSTKEPRAKMRRRPAAGSGNVVLEWVSPSAVPPTKAAATTATPQAEYQAAPRESPNVALAAASGSETAEAPGLALPSISASIQPKSLMATLLASQPQLLTFLGQALAGSGGITDRASDATAAVAAPGAVPSAAPAAPVNPQPVINTTTPQPALQPFLVHQGNLGVSGVGVAGTFGSTTDGLATLQRLLGIPQTPVPAVSDPTRSSSSATSQSSSGEQAQLRGWSCSIDSSASQQFTGGSRALLALHRGLERAAAATSPAEESGNGLRVCGLEASLLKVMCSFGIPLWSRGTRETAFTAAATSEASTQREDLVLSWMGLGKHLWTECQSSADTAGTVKRLSNDPKLLAKIALFLTKRCVDCTKGNATTAATATAASFGEGGSTAEADLKASLTKGDTDILEFALTQWSLELNDCSALDGSFVTGSILETMEMPLQEDEQVRQKSASQRCELTVAALVSSGECQTMVETWATLLQLRWIFQHHSTATIYNYLLRCNSKAHLQGDEASRDYLLLKGVLAHGLVNELEFRVQQGGSNNNMTRTTTTTTTTHNQLEDRIYLLTKLLFKQLSDLKKKEAALALQHTYTQLTGL